MNEILEELEAIAKQVQRLWMASYNGVTYPGMAKAVFSSSALAGLSTPQSIQTQLCKVINLRVYN